MHINTRQSGKILGGGIRYLVSQPNYWRTCPRPSPVSAPICCISALADMQHIGAFYLRHGFFVLDVAVTADEVPSALVLVNAAVQLGALEGARAARVTEHRMFVLHRKAHLELLLMSLQSAHFLDVFHVPASTIHSPVMFPLHSVVGVRLRAAVLYWVTVPGPPTSGYPILGEFLSAALMSQKQSSCDLCQHRLSPW